MYYNFMLIYKFSLSLTLVLLCVQVHISCIPTDTRILAQASNGRTETLNKRCTIPRADFIAQQSNQIYLSQEINSTFGIDGDAFIYDFFIGNSAKIETTINSIIFKIIGYFFPGVGLLIMISIMPFAIFCCCCPDNCCTKEIGEKTSDCQKRFPAIVLVILSLMIIAAMFGVYIVNPELETSYTDSQCAVAMLLDDTLNGNYSQDMIQYYIGIDPTAMMATASIAPALDQNNQVSQITSEISITAQKVTKLANQTTNRLELNYSSPLNQAPTGNSPTFSKIPEILGSSQEKDSLVGRLYSSLNSLKDSLNTQSSPSALQKILTIGSYVLQQDQNIDLNFESFKTQYMPSIQLIVSIMAGIIGVLSILTIISVFSISCCNKFGCRNLLYFSCIILSILGFVMFVLAIVMSGGAVVTYYGCNYFDRALDNQTEFIYRLKPFLNNSNNNGRDLYLQLLSQWAVRSPGANNQHQQSSAPPSISDSLDQLKKIDASLVDSLEKYQRAEILDISSVENIQEIQNLSNSSKYSCSAVTFSGDSWVPSTRKQNLYAPCKISAPVVTKKGCKTKEELQLGTIACSGCMDTYSLFSGYQSYQEVLSILSARYSEPDCQKFNQDVAHNWFNYHFKKSQALQPVIIRTSQVSQNVKSIIKNTNYFLYSQKLNKLQRSSILLSFVPSSVGVVSQLNFKVLAEDFNLILKTTCTRFFNYSYKMRLCTMIASFCMLLVLIFGVKYGRTAYFLQKNVEMEYEIPQIQNTTEQGRLFNKEQDHKLGTTFMRDSLV